MTTPRRVTRAPCLGGRLPVAVFSVNLLLGLPSVAAADDKATPAAPLVEAGPVEVGSEIAFVKETLPNGLELIVHEDHRLPRVAVNVWYHVGPANEPPGRSGFAHLFEHLMFEGSRHVGDRFDRLLESIGATNVNGTTSWDRTNYFETVPREHLELALWIESDRMGFLSDALTPQGFSVQRDVVKNERRESYENTPYGPSALAFYETLFPTTHPYHGAIIGSMQDISAATLAEARDFHRNYYAASNATLTIAGDVDPARARTLVMKYFGSLPAVPRPPRAMARALPSQPARRVEVAEPVQLARVNLGWTAPRAFSADSVPLDLAMRVLAGGKASRLYRRLVVNERKASSVSASQDEAELASIVSIDATATTGTDPQALERAIQEELRRLAEKGPTAAELDRARRATLLEIEQELEQLNGAGGDSGRAGLLQHFNHYVGDPGFLPRWLARVREAGADDVRRAVATHLDANRCVAVVTLPRAPARETSAPAQSPGQHP